MNDYMDMNHAPAVGKPQAEGFLPDYRFASPDEIRALTINHLAKLEAELHTLRMAYVANGKNANLMIGKDRKLGTEMQRIEQSLEDLPAYFRSVLEH